MITSSHECNSHKRWMILWSKEDFVVILENWLIEIAHFYSIITCFDFPTEYSQTYCIASTTISHKRDPSCWTPRASAPPTRPPALAALPSDNRRSVMRMQSGTVFIGYSTNLNSFISIRFTSHTSAASIRSITVPSAISHIYSTPNYSIHFHTFVSLMYHSTALTISGNNSLWSKNYRVLRIEYKLKS